MSFTNGILNLTNWAGNVILPTLAGLFLPCFCLGWCAWRSSLFCRAPEGSVYQGRPMALEVTPIYRNLRTRVTFFGLEAEDLFAILALAVVANILGRFLHREMFGLPMNMVLQYVVPVLSIPALMLFKYGKQRGYLQDWIMFHSKPHVYSALERDHELTSSYIRG